MFYLRDYNEFLNRYIYISGERERNLKGVPFQKRANSVFENSLETYRRRRIVLETIRRRSVTDYGYSGAINDQSGPRIGEQCDYILSTAKRHPDIVDTPPLGGRRRRT